MNKVLFGFLFLTLCAGLSHAGVREVKDKVEGATHFGYVEATGSDATGNPGFFSVIAPDANGVNFTRYLWVNTAGKLCLASYPTISAYASFPTASWGTSSMGCTIVGTQS